MLEFSNDVGADVFTLTAVFSGLQVLADVSLDFDDSRHSFMLHEWQS
jgi:hypothetical protein